MYVNIINLHISYKNITLMFLLGKLPFNVNFIEDAKQGRMTQWEYFHLMKYQMYF